METAIFAGGCFWGVEYYMLNQSGVISAESGYIGGNVADPTYEMVKSHSTGHAEAVRVIFDPSIVSYEALAKLFFEIHDPTQENRQGVDIGEQYRSEIFYTTPQQQATAMKLIEILREKGFDVVTRVTRATNFYRAEEYHQKYYKRHEREPSCHFKVKRF